MKLFFLRRSFTGVALLFGVFWSISPVMARENVTEWYVQDLRAEFALTSRSTMVVTEWITADCGQCVGKHGIFRVVPTEARTEKDTIKTPVELLEITDFSGKKQTYTETRNKGNGTVTWKIGDPDKTVVGVNKYRITYAVSNVIRDQVGRGDEFYWNIHGDFWDIPVDAFSATIMFPGAVKEQVTDVSVYAGARGATGAEAVSFLWLNPQTLSVTGTRPFLPGEGVTVSVSVPKGIFTLYQFGWWEQYGQYLWLIIPIAVFFICYRAWKKYGDDPAWDKVVIPEYQVPGQLSVLEVGLLMNNGSALKNEYVTAAIIELAVLGALTIREEKNKILFFTMTEYVLEKQSVPGLVLSSHQQLLLDHIFKTGTTVALSSLKKTFYKVLSALKESALASLAEKGLIERGGRYYQITFLIAAGVLGFSFFGLLFDADTRIKGAALLLAAILFLGFGLIMPKRTRLGTETHWKIKGLKLYMEKAENIVSSSMKKKSCLRCCCLVLSPLV